MVEAITEGFARPRAITWTRGPVDLLRCEGEPEGLAPRLNHANVSTPRARASTQPEASTQPATRSTPASPRSMLQSKRAKRSPSRAGRGGVGRASPSFFNSSFRYRVKYASSRFVKTVDPLTRSRNRERARAPRPRPRAQLLNSDSWIT